MAMGSQELIKPTYDMKKFFRKTWRFFIAFIIASITKGYGMSFWETMLIIAVIAIVVEYIIYHNQKKKSKC